MTEEAEELSGRALVGLSALLDVSVCVSTTGGTEGASGSSHFIKPPRSLLVLSRLCWPVSSNKRDVNAIQQDHRDPGSAEDDGIGRRLQRNIPRGQTQMSHWWGEIPM